VCIPFRFISNFWLSAERNHPSDPNSLLMTKTQGGKEPGETKKKEIERKPQLFARKWIPAGIMTKKLLAKRVRRGKKRQRRKLEKKKLGEEKKGEKKKIVRPNLSAETKLSNTAHDWGKRAEE